MTGQHEKTDVHVPSINWFLVGLFGLIAVSLALMWVMFAWLARQEEQAPRPTLMEAQRVLPPAPRLQVSNTQDLDALRARGTKALTSYGWVRQETGIVRIPVERAMDLVVERGVAAPEKKK
ncbi:MAG: hypothetical protein FJW20_21265 [Acidimicrobiia bacterium]|nr:hypothetical protein [Acidimicrobiia bacterium]